MKIVSNMTESTADRLGRHLAARLNDAAAEVPADIGVRLRFARERALARARQAHAVALQRPVVASAPLSAWAPAVSPAGAGGMLHLPGNPLDSLAGLGSRAWGGKLASLLPLLILVLGLLAVQTVLRERQIEAAAEVDTALLADDLPPQAYSDPGFAEFLRRQER